MFDEDAVALGTDQMRAGERDDIRRFVDLVGVDQPGPVEEIADRRIGDRRRRLLQRGFTYMRLQPLHAGRFGQPRTSVDPHQLEHVTGVDQETPGATARARPRSSTGVIGAVWMLADAALAAAAVDAGRACGPEQPAVHSVNSGAISVDATVPYPNRARNPLNSPIIGSLIGDCLDSGTKPSRCVRLAMKAPR